jgi:hypothetical protein
MTRNNTDFKESALYHGTIHPFKEGDIVLPGSSGFSYATNNGGYAVRQANKQGVKNAMGPFKEDQGPPVPRVFTVKPVDNSEAETYETEVGKKLGATQYRSKKGYVVTGELPISGKQMQNWYELLG